VAADGLAVVRMMAFVITGTRSGGERMKRPVLEDAHPCSPSAQVTCSDALEKVKVPDGERAETRDRLGLARLEYEDFR